MQADRAAIEAALLELAEAQGSADAVRSRLAGVAPESDAVVWFAAAAEAIAPLLDEQTALASAEVALDAAWDGRLGRALARGAGGLDPAHHPPEAHAALAEGRLLRAMDADLHLLWENGGRLGVYHAHPSGFWCVAPDLAAWVRGVAEARRSGASPAQVRARLEAWAAASPARRFRTVLATGQGRALAEAAEGAMDPAGRLAAHGAAGPGWGFRVYTVQKVKRGGVRVREETVHFSGAGADLVGAAPALAAALAGRSFRIWAQPAAGTGVLEVEDGLGREKLLQRAERFAGQKQRGALLIIDGTGEPAGSAGGLDLSAPAATPDVKARLQQLTREAGRGTRFTVRLPDRTQTGLNERKLVRMAGAIAAALGAGGSVQVHADGGGAEAAPSAAPSAPLRL